VDRTEPIDCKVGVPTKRCGGGLTGHRGGYTYADFAKVGGGPEVHSDGEIWAQTLWDLRDRLGSRLSESLVTRGMELAPANPSFLDMRNGILLADTAIYARKHKGAIWRTFAHRGMGFYAGSLGGDDIAPGADFHRPPGTHKTGAIRGTVVDGDTGDPVAGVQVALAFQGAPGSVNPSDVTDAQGRYSIGPVPIGTYPKLIAFGGGYDPATARVKVGTAGVTHDFTLRRDWAATEGGARVSGFTGPNYAGAGCGPGRLFDLSTALGWVTNADLDPKGRVTAATPKQVTVALPQQVDVSEVTIDPTATCGLGLSASLGRFTLQASSDGSQWHDIGGGDLQVADLGHASRVQLSGDLTGLGYVRLVAEAPLVLVDTNPQTGYPADACNPDQGYSGCTYMSAAEMEVHGVGR
jgi:hypothetical protein